MSVGATGSVGQVRNIAVETVRKSHDVVKAEGKAIVKLIDNAGKAAKGHANSNPERGRIIDILA